MDPELQWLMNELRFFHVGRLHAIKSQDLIMKRWGVGAASDRSTNNPYARKLREMIEQLNHDHEGLICSDPKYGYFWASSLQEGLDSVQALKSRALTQLDNMSHLEKNLQRTFGGQLTMGGMGR